MTRIIPLTQGKQAIVDDADYERLAAFKWHYHDGYAQSWIEKKHIRMHRVLIDAPANMEIDHVNGDGTDNRRGNLRVCTHAENGRNQRTNTKNRSGFKGVCWYRQTSKWRAQIKVGMTKMHIGYFDSIENAARAYDAAAREHFGEFARTNFQGELSE